MDSKKPSVFSGSPPSLVIYGQGSASTSWSRTQRRRYSTMISWMKQAEGRGHQLFRVDLTTAAGGFSSDLTKDFRELRRRIKRVYGYIIEFLKVETSEGHGVLHMVWAIDQRRAAFIPQRWLSDEWFKIHGASIVYICRVKGFNSSKRISRYFISQYFAGQSAIVRMTYSWWMCKFALMKTFHSLRREFLGVKNYSSPWNRGFRPGVLTFKEFLSVWDDFLFRGTCQVLQYQYVVIDRLVQKIPIQGGDYVQN